MTAQSMVSRYAISWKISTYAIDTPGISIYEYDTYDTDPAITSIWRYIDWFF
jgi:hypothetical protein